MTAVGRCAAQAQGWYEGRRAVQMALIAGLAAATLIGGTVLALALGRTLRRTWLALLGLVWIGGFVTIRAAGFHHVDRLIGADLGPLEVNWVAEIGGLALVLLGAMLSRQRAGDAMSPERRAGDGPGPTGDPAPRHRR